ncbi:MAG TPA: hypothetical protein VGK89_00235 [Candidatus Eisenbacteria bacterium]|jgi:hypothetical protein
MLYLLGRPTLRECIRFIQRRAVDPPAAGRLTEAWGAAAARIAEIEKEEAGLADHPQVQPLGPRYEPLLIELLKDPLAHYAFNTVPVDIVMVPLDRLVVYQNHIDLDFARSLERRLGPAPGEEQIFRTCLPSDHPLPPVEWASDRDGRFVFLSPSNDLRFLRAVPLRSGQVVNTALSGVLVGMVGIAVGFGSNFLNAMHAGNRLILHNGTHRAFALRSAGITHAPCIVQYASSREELDLIAPEAVRKRPEAFLEHPRPALLKDYFDPRLRIVFPSRRRLRQVTVRFQVEEGWVPAV